MNKNLDTNVFSENVEMIPIRKGYGSGLLEAGKRDSDVVALCADLTESTQTHLFKKEFPKRFFEMGVGEQSMASVASGMAAMGKIPFFTSYAVFSPGRNWEQIRTTICYNDVNAKVVGSHAGVSVGPDGGTHQAIEDIAITRVIPKMTVIVPCDAREAHKATLAVAKHKGPVYIRLQREDTPIITSEDAEFEIGKAYKLYESDKPKLTIFSCGGILYKALKAAKELEKDGVNCNVVNVPTIKPLDERIIEYAKAGEAVVVIEEHQRIGGLGGAIAEMLSSKDAMPILRIGIEDKFGQSGEPEELLDHYGLSVEKIKEKISNFI